MNKYLILIIIVVILLLKFSSTTKSEQIEHADLQDVPLDYIPAPQITSNISTASTHKADKTVTNIRPPNVNIIKSDSEKISKNSQTFVMNNTNEINFSTKPEPEGKPKFTLNNTNEIDGFKLNKEEDYDLSNIDITDEELGEIIRNIGNIESEYPDALSNENVIASRHNESLNSIYESRSLPVYGSRLLNNKVTSDPMGVKHNPQEDLVKELQRYDEEANGNLIKDVKPYWESLKIRDYTFRTNQNQQSCEINHYKNNNEEYLDMPISKVYDALTNHNVVESDPLLNDDLTAMGNGVPDAIYGATIENKLQLDQLQPRNAQYVEKIASMLPDY